ncbi:MAG TPA: hypothetical protein VF647_19025 [Longimicrobium sp.]
MPSRTQMCLASLLTILCGGGLLASPARADASSEAFDCRASVEEYCSYAAGYCSSGWARCTYTVESCQITNIECIPAPS